MTDVCPAFRIPGTSKTSDDPCFLWCGQTDFAIWKGWAAYWVRGALQLGNITPAQRQRLESYDLLIASMSPAMDSTGAVQRLAAICRVVQCFATRLPADRPELPRYDVLPGGESTSLPDVIRSGKNVITLALVAAIAFMLLKGGGWTRSKRP
jgi:hypothetical protein